MNMYSYCKGNGEKMSSKTETSDSDISYDISAAIANKKKKQEEERTKAIAAEKEAKRAKSRRTMKTVIICVILGAVILGALYLIGLASSTGKFLKNTSINGFDVSGMNATEAAIALKSFDNADKVTINARNGKTVDIPFSDFGYNTDYATPVRRLYEGQDHSLWFMSYFKATDYTIDTGATYDEVKLDRLLGRTVWGTVDTSDASIEYGAEGYYIKPEVYGDTVDREKLSAYVKECLDSCDYNIDLEDSGCYREPAVVSEDLKDELELIKEKFDFVITYDMNYTQEILTGAEVYSWTAPDGTVDRTKAEDFIDRLADKYDTFMTTRSFKTTERGTIQMAQGRYSTGQYGWWTDREKSVEKLMGYIEKGESVTVEPMYVTLDTGYCYEGFPSGRSATDDIGNTYIEVDLSAQHLWYYQNGELAFETTSIVSGKATDPARKTPEGVYSVYTKSTNYMMRAADGSYNTRCAYFMRISFEGIGLHDLSRSSYGGNTYINNGSHGCINMRYSEVETLYNMVERGTPVILYY